MTALIDADSLIYKPLRVCKDCGLEANTIEELELFSNGNESLYKKQNLCLACNRKRTVINNINNKGRRESSATARRYKNKEILIARRGGECVDCGYKYNGKNAIVFDFHHRNPDDKLFGIAPRIHYNLKTLKVEADKCDLLCANCHRLRHNEVVL